MVRSLGVEVEHTEYDDIATSDKIVDIKLLWKPTIEDDQFPPRFELSISSLDEKNQIVKVRYPLDNNGVCRADFTVLKSATGNTMLVFWNGQNTVHSFILSDYLSGFRESKSGFGFESVLACETR